MHLVDGDQAFIDFEELRHPALCASTSLKGDFIPNDVKLGGDVGRIAMLTGTHARSFSACRSSLIMPRTGPNMGYVITIAQRWRY